MKEVFILQKRVFDYVSNTWSNFYVHSVYSCLADANRVCDYFRRFYSNDDSVDFVVEKYSVI